MSTKKIRSGHKKTKFDEKLKKINVQENEMVTSSDVSKSETKSVPRKRLDTVSKTNKSKLKHKLEADVEKSLDFVESYGVIPKQLICETLTGDPCVLNVDGRKTQQISYENMSSDAKHEVKSMLNVCDNAMISDSAYHEIAMRMPTLPRRNHLIACRNEINQTFDVKRTPGMLPGSYLSIQTELENLVLAIEKDEGTIPTNLKIKISGDGAKVSRVSNFIVVSFSLVNGKGGVSHKNQRVLAVVNTDENYSNLKSSLGPLFDEINALNAKPVLQVRNVDVKLEFFVGGDMKFLQILLGLNSSIATYCCPWCKVPKDSRGNISFPWNHYHENDTQRKVDEMRQLCTSSCAKANFGSKYAPLLDIDIDHYIPDELHLLMRITDILLRNLIDDAMSKDQYAKLVGQATDNLELLVKAIQNCGVSFRTWVTKTGEFEYTFLSGNDQKTLLRNLPERLLFCLHEDTQEDVINLWKNFRAIYTMITDNDCNAEFDSSHVFSKVRSFVEDFLKIGTKKREGYQPKNVTPYLHVLVYHVPYFVGRYGSLIQFSGQGVEKTNDIVKQIHQARSSKIDATTEALICRKRLELGYSESNVRTKRKYEKTDDRYWSHEKSKQMLTKKQKIQTEMKEADENYTNSKPQVSIDAVDNMSVPEIKAKLNELGRPSKARLKSKVVILLKEALAAAKL